MKLSGNGNIALEQWHWLGRQYQYIDLLSFVIMPDHVHGIIHINTNYYIDNCVGKGLDASLHNSIRWLFHRRYMQRNTIICT